MFIFSFSIAVAEARAPHSRNYLDNSNDWSDPEDTELDNYRGYSLARDANGKVFKLGSSSACAAAAEPATAAAGNVENEEKMDVSPLVMPLDVPLTASSMLLPDLFSAKPMRIGAPSVAAVPPPAYKSVRPLKIDDLPLPLLPPRHVTVSGASAPVADFLYNDRMYDEQMDMAIAASLEDMKLRAGHEEMHGIHAGSNGAGGPASGSTGGSGESSRDAYVNAILKVIQQEAAAGKGKGKMPTSYDEIVRWDEGRPRKVDPVTSRQQRREKEAMRPTPPDEYDSDGNLIFIGIGSAERRLVDAHVELPAKVQQQQ